MDQRYEDVLEKIQGWAEMHDYVVVVRTDTNRLHVNNVTTKHAIAFNNWNDRSLHLPSQTVGNWRWHPSGDGHQLVIPLATLSQRRG